MRVLNLYYPYDRGLEEIPDISSLPNLEEFSIQECDELITIDNSFGFLCKLKILRILDCRQIQSIPPLRLASLEELHISGCHGLENFLPVVDGFGDKLKTMSFRDCHNLRSIPPLKLDSLETLDLSNCHNLMSIGTLKLDSLETLDLPYCVSLESFPLVDDMFLGKLKTLLVTNCHNLKSIPPLKLDALETLDLSNCFALESFSSVGGGLLDKLKFINMEYCILLRSIPQLRLTSLEHFNLSCCYSLESFPEILGEMRNIPGLLLDETSINELPFPCHNLTQPQTFHPCECEYIGQWQDYSYTPGVQLTILNEEKVIPIQSSNVKYICVRNIKLSDELLSKTLMLFANVKELHLADNQLTIIPKSIENCHFLWKLLLDNSKKLQEIKGIPPCLRELSALNCMSLTSSCKSKLLNQVMIYFVFNCTVFYILLDIVKLTLIIYDQ